MKIVLDHLLIISKKKKDTTTGNFVSYHVVTHRHKKVKKQLSALLHFHLHRAAALKSRSASDNQS
jgi:hypothetical protein